MFTALLLSVFTVVLILWGFTLLVSQKKQFDDVTFDSNFSGLFFPTIFVGLDQDINQKTISINENKSVIAALGVEMW